MNERTLATEDTEKHRVEREFHDRWARGVDVDGLLVRESFDAATAAENRWAFEALSPVRGKRLLDLGCGAGESSVYFALNGARVDAVDISPEFIAVLRRLAARHGVEIASRIAPAEALPFPDATFDLVFGNGVLHHVELVPALKEIRRVLKPGGKAAFVEPLKHNPVIEVYRRLACDNRTPTESPLGFDDFSRVRSVFPRLSHREFWLTTLYLFVHFFIVERAPPGKVRYWKKVVEDAPRLAWLYGPLKRLDDRLLGLCPWLGRLCWNTVLVLEKEPS